MGEKRDEKKFVDANSCGRLTPRERSEVKDFQMHFHKSQWIWNNLLSFSPSLCRLSPLLSTLLSVLVVTQRKDLVFSVQLFFFNYTIENGKIFALSHSLALSKEAIKK